jgi:arylsulfatase A-like enzyme
MDKTVGRLVNKLDELGIRENTVIIFTGDNGTDRKVISNWQGQRIAGMKGYTVEAGTHVPLIVNWQGTVAAGQKNKNLIDFTDFFPTLVDIAGTGLEQLDGISFYGQLLGEETQVRDWIFCHYQPNWGKFPDRRYVQNDQWKLYDSGEFYNFRQDPAEQQSIPEDKLNAEEIALKLSFQQVLDGMN